MGLTYRCCTLMKGLPFVCISEQMNHIVLLLVVLLSAFNGHALRRRHHLKASCPPCPANGTMCQSDYPDQCGITAPLLCIPTGGCSSTPPAKCPDCCDSSGCFPPSPPCDESQCEIPCPSGDNVFCSDHGCGKRQWWGYGQCCNRSNCKSFPPPNPWDRVPPSPNCSFEYPPRMEPDPRATSIGGTSVEHLRCKANVTESCCGFTPRFNWVLAGCHKNPADRTSMACTHAGASKTDLSLFYVAAYQFNGSHWVKDHNSSLQPEQPPPATVNLSKFYLGNNFGSDWDIKYGPRTDYTGTQGLGPPAMLFVLSALKFSWSSFYVLNQITINRGPSDLDNCWNSSTGEFDILEPPFWYDVLLPEERLYTTVNADSGRCLPTQQEVPKMFSSFCTDPNCCEMCDCQPGDICFGDPLWIGFQPMNCIPANQSHLIPPGSTVFSILNSSTMCSNFSGGLGGGSDANAFFAQFEVAPDATSFVHATVIDRDGVSTYRWMTHGDAEEDDSVWTGLGAYRSAPVLSQLRPRGVNMTPPCLTPYPCGYFLPSCVGDCPVNLAAGQNYGYNERAGPYAAEAARDGLNFWESFVSTDQPHTSPMSMPFELNLPHPTCVNRCPSLICHSLTRCAAANPYQCTRSRSLNITGACSASPTHWRKLESCLDCCDTSFCTFRCTKCDASLCHPPLCGPAVPYQCTGGKSKGGCSANSTFWGDTPACTSCCYCS